MSEGSLVAKRVKKFTWKELSQLNKKWNAHVAYEGKVYDVSRFVSHHPGGTEAILLGAGRDITQVFKSYHKSDTFQRVLSKYYVGELIDNEFPVFPKESEFNILIKQRVALYLKEHNLDPKIDYKGFFFSFILLIVYYALYCSTIWFHNLPIIVLVLFTLVRGLLVTGIGGMFHHSACHFAITHKPWIWKVLNIFTSWLVGVTRIYFINDHVFGHHLYTNIPGADPDLYPGPTGTETVLFRLVKKQKWVPRIEYQHIYLPFLYFMIALQMKLTDFFCIRAMKIAHVRINPLSTTQWIEFWIEKLGYIIVQVVIPLWYLPLARAIAIFAVYELAASEIISFFFMLSHITEEAVWPSVDESSNVVDRDWAELQVESSQDYCTDSWFWTVVSSALNHQAAHHLFPGYYQTHYTWITPIVRKTCAEMNIKYNCVDSFMEATKLHFKFLKEMGKKEQS